jgi:hypothetical protein
MIRKPFCVLFFLNLCLSVFPQTTQPVIHEIGLIDSDIYRGAFPPSRLIVGLEVGTDIYYKLYSNETILKGGRFLKGYNSFSLEADDLFARSGIHTYTLELKVDDHISRQEFEIAIALDEEVLPALEENEANTKEYSVLMYIGNQLVASSKKLPTSRPSRKVEVPPPPYQINPYASAAEPDYTDTGVPLTSIAAALYQTIKSLTEKKNEEARTPPIRKKSMITSTFKRTRPNGQEYKVTATITLRTSFR